MQVFISYAEADRALAVAIRQELAAKGIEAWVDQAVGAGESVSEAINEALDTADVYVLLLSKHWLSSEWALIELSGSLVRSMRHGRPLIPVVTERGVQVPAVLRDRHYLDISAHRGDMRPTDTVADIVDAVSQVGEPASRRAVGSSATLDDASTVMSLELAAFNASQTMFDSWLRTWMRWTLMVTILAGLTVVAIATRPDWIAGVSIAALLLLVLPLLRAELAARFAQMISSYVAGTRRTR